MKNLDQSQREFLANFCEKFSLMILAALMLGELIPWYDGSLLEIIIGSLTALFIVSLGSYLLRPISD